MTLKEAMQELSQAYAKVEASTTTLIIPDDLCNIQVSADCLMTIRRVLEVPDGQNQPG